MKIRAGLVALVLAVASFGTASAVEPEDAWTRAWLKEKPRIKEIGARPGGFFEVVDPEYFQEPGRSILQKPLRVPPGTQVLPGQRILVSDTDRDVPREIFPGVLYAQGEQVPVVQQND